MSTQTHIVETESSLAQAYAQLESIKEMVEALEHANQAKEHERSTNAWAASEEAAQAIHESALSVQVRSGWHVPGDEAEATEYVIPLWADRLFKNSSASGCDTGGPAVRIVGELNQYGEPVTATLEHQHWFTPWTRVDLRASTVLNAEGVMLTYANQFYFGG